MAGMNWKGAPNNPGSAKIRCEKYQSCLLKQVWAQAPRRDEAVADRPEEVVEAQGADDRQTNVDPGSVMAPAGPGPRGIRPHLGDGCSIITCAQ